MSRISASSQIGEGCQIAPTAIIHDNVVLGDGCQIDDWCIIGAPARGEAAGKTLNIGSGAHIRSHSILYEGSSYGPDLRVGHHSMLRENLVVGKNLQVGTFNDLEGDAEIGDWVRFHSQVHLSKGSVVGDLAWIFPNVVTTNDPIPPSGLCVGTEVGAGGIVATGALLLPGCKLGAGAFVAACALAKGDVPAGALVVGNPGKIIGSVRRLKYKPAELQHPWMEHHADAYPEEAQARIAEVREEILAACDTLDAELATA